MADAVLIEIASLHQGTIENQRSRLDGMCVESYMVHLDGADPVLVYENDRERILVNGHHRVEAARRLGRTSIRADVRSGTRQNAVQYRDLHGQPG